LFYFLFFFGEDKDKVAIFIDPQALLTVIGTQMDYKEDTLVSEFTFTNPNAKSACGCGESFKV
jgi:iron-sulfur cluster assembly accessory protein